jgi:hypothetical protein
MTKIAGYGSICQRHRSADPDPQQNFMDPEHCLEVLKLSTQILLLGCNVTTAGLNFLKVLELAMQISSPWAVG